MQCYHVSNVVSDISTWNTISREVRDPTFGGHIINTLFEQWIILFVTFTEEIQSDKISTKNSDEVNSE